MIKNEKGTTIFELLLVLAITAVIASALVGVIYQILDITSRGNNELLVQHDLQNAATWFNRDVLTAFRATIAGSEETGIYTMTLEVPYLNIEEGEISYSYITYTYSEETEDLTRDYGDSSLTIARHIASNPFRLVTDIETTNVITAPNVITVTLDSLEGNVPGSGKFALKMRAGGSIAAVRLCQVTGADDLNIDPDSRTVRWDITNNGGDTASIDQIIIDWPSANGALTEIWWVGGTSSIFAQSQGDPPATIVGPWAGDRTIDSGGTQKTLEFWFEAGAVDEDLYSIEITFDNGCIIPFP